MLSIFVSFSKEDLVTKRIPTIIDVAEAAGVSTATVSRVLNKGKVSDLTKDTVENAIEELGYRRNTVARSLVMGKSGVIGVLIPDVTGALYAQMARGIEDVLNKYNLQYILVSGDRNIEQEQSALELLLERQIDALILIGSDLDENTLSKLLKNVYVTVFIQRESNGELRNTSIDSNTHADGLTVGIDNYQAAQDATNYLIQRGHKKIAHITATRHDGRTRLQAFTNALEQANLATNLIAEGYGTEEGGYKAAQTLLHSENDSPTAIFCGNDRIAAGAYKAIKEHGLAIPQDISVIAFDNLPWAEYLDPPLTTIRQPGQAMGEVAAFKILDTLGELDDAPDEALERARETTISYELIERSSVHDLRSSKL